MAKQVPLYIKKWKTSRNEVTYNSCIKSKTRRKLHSYVTPRVSSLYDTLDGNEGLLHSHYYWKSERPGEIKLLDRQFLIPSENKKYGFVKG